MVLVNVVLRVLRRRRQRLVKRGALIHGISAHRCRPLVAVLPVVKEQGGGGRGEGRCA
jgi:hypothetical protein